MKEFFKKYWVLILIVILAVFLRFYHLDSYPAINADEASNAYDAYSLIQTGKDQHGNPWPISFQSFNDFKPGLYVYLAVPFVKLLGLNAWSARIPGAALGVLSIIAIYLLVRQLFDDKKIALFSALFLAISPWHIQFSRGGWEVNVSTFFIISGVWLLIRAVKKPSLGRYLLGIITLVISLYAYHSARIVAPLLGIAIIGIYHKEIVKNIKPLLISGLIGVVLILPLAKNLLGSGAMSRVAGVGLFADIGQINRINEQRGEHSDPISLSAKVLHNKAVNYGLLFVENWASHYHGEFLFLSGDSIQRNKVPETGEFYIVDILFIAAGLVLIAKKFNRQWGLVVFWLIIAPIPSALTFQSPNALRAQNMVVPLTIISAAGFTYLISRLKTVGKLLKVAGYGLMIALIIWSFARYEHMYWVHMAKEYPFSSQYGVEQLVDYLAQNMDDYEHVVVTDRYDQPYILFLYYLKYLPQQFIGNHTLTPRDAYGFSTVRNFDKFIFTPIDNWGEIRQEYNNSLIAGTDEEIPDGTNVVKRIYFPNGEIAFEVVAN